MKATFTFDTTDVDGYGAMIGSRKGNYNNNALGFFTRFNASKFCFYRTGQEAQGTHAMDATPDTSTSYPLILSPVILTLDGNKAEWYYENDPANVMSITASNATVNAGNAPLGLFCHNSTNDADGWNPVDLGKMALYYCEIYESGVLEHRFVPAYNNSQFCLYDEVGQTYIYDRSNNGNYMRAFNVPTT